MSLQGQQSYGGKQPCPYNAKNPLDLDVGNGAMKIAVTTDADFYEEHSDSVEFWTPGSPAFPPPSASPVPLDAPALTLADLLNRAP